MAQPGMHDLVMAVTESLGETLEGVTVWAYLRADVPSALTVYVHPDQDLAETGVAFNADVLGEVLKEYRLSVIIEVPWTDSMESFGAASAAREDVRTWLETNRDLEIEGGGLAQQGTDQGCRWAFVTRKGVAAQNHGLFVTLSWKT